MPNVSAYLERQGIQPSRYSPERPLRVLVDSSAILWSKADFFSTEADWHELALVPRVVKEVRSVTQSLLRGEFTTSYSDAVSMMARMRTVRPNCPNPGELELISHSARQAYADLPRWKKKKNRNLREGRPAASDTEQIVHAIRRAHRLKHTVLLTRDYGLKATLTKAAASLGYDRLIEVKPM